MHLKETLLNLKKGNQSLEDNIKKFKAVCDKLAATKKRLDDLTKVLHLARGPGTRYKDLRIAMLSKPPYPSYNQFVLALKNNDQQLIIEEEEEKSSQLIPKLAIFTQHGRGRGRNFYPRGRGFQHNISQYTHNSH